MPSVALRSLADDLRGRPDQQLAALILARPDLVHPVPADLAGLAQRAGSPASVATALRGLDQLELHVVLAAALGPDPITPAELVRAVARHLPAQVPAADARARVRRVVERLRLEALLWGTDRALHLVGPARDLMVPADRGPRVAALDPVVAGYARHPDALETLVADAPPGARAALDRLIAGPLVGTVMDARRVPDPARSPVDWLLAHHLVIPLGVDRAVVPAEVAQILRGTTEPGGPAAIPLDVACLAPPAPLGPAPQASQVEAGSGGAVLDVLHAVAELGHLWAAEPPTRLRAGGIALRDLTRSARRLGRSESETALTIEVAAAAGLLAADSTAEVTVLPTPAFDTWLGQSPPARHADLVLAWRDMPRAAGQPPERPLGPGLVTSHLPGLRRGVLAAMASAPGTWTPDEVLAAMQWQAPRRQESDRSAAILQVLAELPFLGLAASGTLTDAGRALLADDRAGIERALGRVLPGQVDTLVMQADLTAIVPGLPTPELADLMRQLATPESTGAASVYRFCADGVRAALDSGRSAADLLGALGRRGVVPQPVAYLIEDVARRHASLRIGAASTYLRCDDPVLLATILADPGALGLGLVPVSETVLVSEQPPEHVMDRLRRLGHWPLPEPGLGAQPAAPRRARARATPPEPAARDVTPALAAAAVRALRASERTTPAPASRPDGSPTGSGDATRTARPVATQSPAEVVAALRSAIAGATAVWIGYADPTGVAGDRRVEPLRLAGGYVTALDLRTEAISSYALARITGVAPG